MITRSGMNRSITGGYQRTPRSQQAFAGLASMGRGGDSELAHVNPQEAAVLKAMGGSGGINPRTGLREYALGGGPGSQSESSGGSTAPGHTAGTGRGGSGNDLFGDAASFAAALDSYRGGGGGNEFSRDGGDRGDLFSDAAAFSAALDAHRGSQGGGSAAGFRPGLNPEMGPGAQPGRAFIEGAQPTGMQKAIAFGIGAAMPFGIDAKARPDYITGKPALDVTMSPMQTLANLSPLGPLGDVMAPDWGTFTVASVPFGEAQHDPHTGRTESNSGGQEMQAQIDNLVRSVLRAPEPQDTRAAEPARPRPPQQEYVPFEGNPLTYGQPGGVPSHVFFRSS